MLPRNMLYLRTCYFGKCYLGTCYLGTYYFGACYLGTCYLRTCCLGTCSFMRSLSFGCPQKHNSCHMSQDTVPTSKSKKCPMLFSKGLPQELLPVWQFVFKKTCHCMLHAFQAENLNTNKFQTILLVLSFKGFIEWLLSMGQKQLSS